MTDSKPLDGKLALVTGASRGIGAETAAGAGQGWAHVVLTGAQRGRLEEVEEGGSRGGAERDDRADGPHAARISGKLAAALAERDGASSTFSSLTRDARRDHARQDIDAKEYARRKPQFDANQAMIARSTSCCATDKAR